MSDQPITLEHGSDMARPFGDAVSLGVVVATIAEWLPEGGINAAGGSQQWQESADPKSLTGANARAWNRALRIAQEAISGRFEDPTGGATFFHNRSIGTPDTVEGFFDDAQGETIELSPYRSPTDQNYFYRHLEDPLRPVPWRPRPGSSSRR